jgi:hypothetical protein
VLGSRESVAAQASSCGWRWGTELTAGEGVNRRGKRISREDATNARAGWAGRAISACGDGTAGGRAGPEAKRAVGSTGPKIRKKRNFRIKIGFLNLSRL